MAMMESAFGLAGVVWLTGAVVLATVVAVFLVARQYADPLPAVVVALMVVLATSDNLTGRPQVASYLLVLRGHPCVVAHGRGPAAAMVAGAADLGLGRRARHVADRGR